MATGRPFDGAFFDSQFFDVDSAQGTSGGGGPGKYRKKYYRYIATGPLSKPKVEAKIAKVEAKKEQVEKRIDTLESQIAATQDRLAMAKMEETLRRLALQISGMRKDLAELQAIHAELEREEVQLMLLISRLMG